MTVGSVVIPPTKISIGFPRHPKWITEESPERISTMKKHVTFHWFACNCNGVETCLEEEFEEKKKFFKAAFGAYRFEIHN